MSLTLEQLATNAATQEHINTVQKYMNEFVVNLIQRAHVHDKSKLASPEVEIFTEMTPKLAASTYDSEEYREFLKQMKPALDHHYAKNRHHPEHYPLVENEETKAIESYIALVNNLLGSDSISAKDKDTLKGVESLLQQTLANRQSRINGMNLMDVVEMLADWKAAGERQHNGNLRNSIDINARRFGIAPQLRRILENTMELIDR